MKAWQIDAPNEPFVLREVPDPVPQWGEVVIDVKAAGLCHSDVGFHDGTISSHIDHWPMILGHEIAGVVSDVGEGVAGQNAPEQVRRAAGGPGHRWRPAEREGNARGTSRSGPPRAMYVNGAPVPRFTVHLTGSGRLAGGWMSVP